MAAAGPPRLLALSIESRLEQHMLPAMHASRFQSLRCPRHRSARLGLRAYVLVRLCHAECSLRSDLLLQASSSSSPPRATPKKAASPAVMPSRAQLRSLWPLYCKTFLQRQIASAICDGSHCRSEWPRAAKLCCERLQSGVQLHCLPTMSPASL